MSTRANPNERSSTEKLSALCDRRLHDRTTLQETMLVAKDNAEALAYDVVYTTEMQRLMLLAYQDDHGYTAPGQKAYVRDLFRRRKAWKLGTLFCNVWRTVGVIKVGALSQHGWSLEKIDQHNETRGPAEGMNLIALLLEVYQFMSSMTFVECLHASKCQMRAFFIWHLTVYS